MDLIKILALARALSLSRVGNATKTACSGCGLFQRVGVTVGVDAVVQQASGVCVWPPWLLVRPWDSAGRVGPWLLF